MKSIKKLLSLVLLIVVAIFIGYYIFQSGMINDILDLFKGKDTKIVKLQEAGYSQQTVDTLIEGNNKFAFDLFQQYLSDETLSNENIFYSPISVHSALSMTYEGAKGDTADEISKTLYLDENSELRLPSYARIFNEINKGEENYSLSIANALWMQKDYPVKDEYKKVITDYYGGEARNLDFIDDTDNSRETINKWVEEKTTNKIKNLFSEGSINPDTRLILTNAIYFKGDWEIQFEPKNTQKETFFTFSGKNQEVDMMKLTGESFNYMGDENVQILEMDYKGGDVSMIIILPREGKFEDVQKMLTLDKYTEWKKDMNIKEVNVYIPKFKIETETSLKKYLVNLGIKDAFEPGIANFSGIDGSQNLYIESVIHKAFVEVNEEGTEATAATGVTVGITSMPQVYTFRVDRPFLFFIQQKESGNILFMGRVGDLS